MRNSRTVIVLIASVLIGGLVAYPIDIVNAASGGRFCYSGNPATQDGMICTACHAGGSTPVVSLSGPTRVADFVVDVEASYTSGLFDLDFTLDTPAPATWAVYLILTSPSIQVLPLWTVSLPVISTPITIPISFPYWTFGLTGIWTGLFTAQGAQATDIALFDAGFVGYAGPDGEALRYYLPPERLLELTENPNPDIWIVDVRTSSEYTAGHIATALSFPSTEIAFRLDELPLSVNLILYCETGGRVQNVIENVLEPNGYTRFMNWGGVVSWPYALVAGSD